MELAIWSEDSSTRWVIPVAAARAPALSPAGPEPTIATSNSLCMLDNLYGPETLALLCRVARASRATCLVAPVHELSKRQNITASKALVAGPSQRMVG